MEYIMQRLSVYSILIVFMVSMVACGNGEGTPAEESEAVADDDVRTIEIIGTDDMRFVVAEEADGLVTAGQVGDEYELTQIQASPGERLRIILHTRSELPATAMSHNLAIVDLDADVDQFVRESATAADNEYIAPAFEDQIIATTAMLGGGESDTIEFDVPEEQGEYEYACTFPGHFAAGMRGQLVVE